MEEAQTIYAKDRKEWRSWLQINHNSRESIWLIYYKKHTGQTSIPYSDAVEEAICFGWIDGQIKKIDDDRYMQRFTPRKSKSLWSELNIERAKKIISLGFMTASGLNAYQEGMKLKERVPSSKNFTVPAYLKAALIKNKKAWSNFQRYSPSAQLAYVYWVNAAKTEVIRQKRIQKTIAQLINSKKFGDD